MKEEQQQAAESQMHTPQATTPDYGADSITALEGLEAVRKRPGMYIGSTDFKGLHHLVWEVVDNSIDEHLAGHCSHIEVTILADNSVKVRDNGRGIPTGIHEKLKKSALEVVMTVLHAGGKFDKNNYKVSGGLHGVGVSCVNALSSRLYVNVFREGKVFEQEYRQGKPQYDVRVIGESTERGTEVTFTPDHEIFETLDYKYDTIAHRLRELSYLNKRLRLKLTDERDKNDDGTFKSQDFYSEGGLQEFAVWLDEAKTHLIEKPIS